MLNFSDYNFELAYKIKEVNQLSKNITKDENNIFIIEKTIDAKNIFSKTFHKFTSFFSISFL